jgi:GWxTD domain-containing protein
MIPRGSGRLIASALLFTAVAAPAASPRRSLDKEAEAWLRQVHLFILPDEEAAFRALPTAEDRAQFRRIFWARRDPDPATQRNELQESVSRAQARADELFALPGSRGSETGCGQLLALLGEPLEVQGGAPGEIQGRGAREQFNSLQPMAQGARRPETWIYRSRPGEPLAFTGGELRIALDEACRFSEAGRILEDLRRVAEARVVRRDLAYRTTPDGHQVRLEELLRTPGGAPLALPGADRADFPLEAEPKLLLRTTAGQAYAAGLLRIHLQPPIAGGAPPAAVGGTVTTQSFPPSGPPSAGGERRFAATPRPDGTLLASYGLPVGPGPTRLRITVQLADGRAAVASLPLDVPDFEAPGLKASGLVLYPDEPAAPADAGDPYSALTVGPLRLRARFGNAFSAADSLQVVSVLYGGKTDAVSGKASLRARFSILKDGKPVARGADQVLDTPMAVASVGPLPLTGFAPGRYVVKLEATDTTAETTTNQEASFEVQD